MVTIEEIREKGQPSSKLSNDSRVARFLRRVSPHFTRLCIKAGITANQVSAFNLLLVLLTCSLAFYGGRYLFLSAILIVFVSNVLDNVDGEIARTTNTMTSMGQRLEVLSYTVLPGGFLFFSSIGLYDRHDNIVYLFTGLLFLFIVFFDYRLLLSIETGDDRVRVTEQSGVHQRPGSALWRIFKLVELNRLGFLFFGVFQVVFSMYTADFSLEPFFVYYFILGMQNITKLLIHIVVQSVGRI